MHRNGARVVAVVLSCLASACASGPPGPPGGGPPGGPGGGPGAQLQESKITLEQIGPKLQAVAGENKEARIFVRGDRAIDYGTMMKVVGEIQAGGFLKVALISES